MANNKLINRSHTKDYILDAVQRLRPEWGANRVAGHVIDQLDYKVRQYIIDAIKRHPTVGKTVTQILV